MISLLHCEDEAFVMDDVDTIPTLDPRIIPGHPFKGNGKMHTSSLLGSELPQRLS
jgi:hypothetical protein